MCDFGGDIVKRNEMLITCRGKRVNLLNSNISMYFLHTDLCTDKGSLFSNQGRLLSVIIPLFL